MTKIQPREDGQIHVTVVSTEGCINTPRAIDRLNEIAEELALPIQLQKILVATQEEANQHRFLGSPTVQINDTDIDPAMRDNTKYGFT